MFTDKYNGHIFLNEGLNEENLDKCKIMYLHVTQICP
jgi:hypothetical protein